MKTPIPEPLQPEPYQKKPNTAPGGIRGPRVSPTEAAGSGWKYLRKSIHTRLPAVGLELIVSTICRLSTCRGTRSQYCCASKQQASSAAAAHLLRLIIIVVQSVVRIHGIAPANHLQLATMRVCSGSGSQHLLGLLAHGSVLVSAAWC